MNHSHMGIQYIVYHCFNHIIGIGLSTFFGALEGFPTGTPIAKVQPSGAKGKSDPQWLRHPRSPWPWRPKMRSRTLAQGRAFRVLLEGWDDGICQKPKNIDQRLI